MEYWVTDDNTNHLNSISTTYFQDSQKVYVPKYKIDFLRKNYRRVILNSNGTLTFPNNLTIVQDNDITAPWQIAETSFTTHYGLANPVENVDFTETKESLGKFDSYNYQLTDQGLLLNTDINLETGLAQPARFRAFNLPLVKNQFAITTFKVPQTIQNRGQDFSFWYFNTKSKYGFMSGITDYDATEFDVDEIRGTIHAATIYAKDGTPTYATPSLDNNFYKEYHTLGIKWTDNSLDFLLDSQVLLHKDVVTESDTMFPTWEIEVPDDQYSNTFMGHIHSEDFPAQAIVKSYKVYQL